MQKINPNIHLISIFSGGLTECESRRYKGSPALVIHGEKSSQKLSTVLPLLDDVLLHFDNNNSPTLYRITDDRLNGTNFIERLNFHILIQYFKSISKISSQ